MFARGYVTPFRFGGAPVRVHWTLPVGLVLLALPALGPGGAVGAAAVLLAHLLGRLLVGRVRRLPLRALRVHGVGGDGWFPGARAADQTAMAWGGVLAQLALAGLGALGRGAAPGTEGFAADLFATWVLPNLVLGALHLALPFDPFAGDHVWSRAAGAARGPLTSRELRRRHERAVAETEDERVAATIREALRRAAEDAKTSRKKAD